MVYFLYTYNCIKLEECQSHHFPIHSWSFFLFSFVSDATNFFVYSLNRFVLKKSYIPVVSCICYANIPLKCLQTGLRRNTGNYVVKTCNQKFDLCVQFITLLNAFKYVGMWACDSMPLLKGPERCFDSTDLMGALEIMKKSLKNTCQGIHILVKLQAPCLQLYNNGLFFLAIFQVSVICKISRTAIFQNTYHP